MSSLVITAPPATEVEAVIESSAFWPGIDPVKIRKAQRIDDTTPPLRLKGALIEAMAATNGALLRWRSDQQAAGFDSLDAVPAEQIDGTSINVHRYYRAVGSLTKALLLERLRDYDITGKGDKRADAQTDPIDDCRRDHLNAIADISGRSRNTVELI